MASFEAVLQDAVDKGLIAGAVLASTDKNGHLYAKPFGRRGVEEGEHTMTEDTVMWIASCTKLMTTVAVLQCVENGLFTLDEDVARLLPEWKSPDILTGFDEQSGKPATKKATGKITLRQLLTHSSGMGYDGLNPQLLAYRQQEGLAPTFITGDIAYSYSLPLTYEPGHGWDYSPGLEWAGRMVERATGHARLGSYMAEHIWQHLGMTSTTFQILTRPDLEARMCGMTNRDEDGKLSANAPLPFPVKDPKDDEGGAGVYSTATDYVKLLSSILLNDGKILKPETVHSMFQPQLADDTYLNACISHPEFSKYYTPGYPHGIRYNWGLGGLLAPEGLPGRAGKGHLSWSGFPSLQWYVDPERGVCGVYFSQLVPPGDAQSAALFAEYQKALFGGHVHK